METSPAVQRTMEKFNAELDRRAVKTDLSGVLTIDEARSIYAEDIEFARTKLSLPDSYNSRFWLAQLAANAATHAAGQKQEEIDRLNRTINFMLDNASAIAEDVALLNEMHEKENLENAGDDA